MGLLTRLKTALLGPPEASRTDDLRQLRQEVADLQAERVQLVADWAKTRELVLRHLQRAAQYSKLDERAEKRDDLSKRVLEMKNLGGTR